MTADEARTELIERLAYEHKCIPYATGNDYDIARRMLDAIFADRALVFAALGGERVYTVESIEGGIASVPADQHVFVFPENARRAPR